MSKSAQSSSDLIGFNEASRILKVSRGRLYVYINQGRVSKPSNYQNKNLFLPRQWRRSEILALGVVRKRRPYKRKKTSNKAQG